MDPPEQFMLDKFGITYFDIDRLDQLGIAKVMELALDAIDPK